MSILDDVRAKVNKLSPEQVKSELEKLQAQKARQREKQKAKVLSPEGKAKRTAYNKERMQRPEVKEKLKAYHARPEVKAKHKEYQKKRNEKIKLLLERAKELGLDTAPETPANPAPPAEG